MSTTYTRAAVQVGDRIRVFLEPREGLPRYAQTTAERCGYVEGFVDRLESDGTIKVSAPGYPDTRYGMTPYWWVQVWPCRGGFIANVQDAGAFQRHVQGLAVVSGPIREELTWDDGRAPRGWS